MCFDKYFSHQNRNYVHRVSPKNAQTIPRNNNNKDLNLVIYGISKSKKRKKKLSKYCVKNSYNSGNVPWLPSKYTTQIIIVCKIHSGNWLYVCVEKYPWIQSTQFEIKQSEMYMYTRCVTIIKSHANSMNREVW